MSPTCLTSTAVVFEAPRRVELATLDLTAPTQQDVVVAVSHSAISTGTERLLWTGQMPPFPGMGYPLVPGYESIGIVTEAGPQSGYVEGDHVFVPGANCYGAVRGLFGGASSQIVVPGSRIAKVSPELGCKGVLLALAATAYHASHPTQLGASFDGRGQQPDLIVGHGVLGRLLARLAIADGAAAPKVWETDPVRAAGAQGYEVVSPDADANRSYKRIYDCSGDPTLLDTLIARLAPGGEIVLAGFYHEPLAFAFAPAFMREARIRIAAQWQPADLAAVTALAASGALSLDGLLTHTADASDAQGVRAAYETAFTDKACLKMVLDWRRPS